MLSPFHRGVNGNTQRLCNPGVQWYSQWPGFRDPILNHSGVDSEPPTQWNILTALELLFCDPGSRSVIGVPTTCHAYPKQGLGFYLYRSPDISLFINILRVAHLSWCRPASFILHQKMSITEFNKYIKPGLQRPQALQVLQIALSYWDYGNIYMYDLKNSAVLKKNKSVAFSKNILTEYIIYTKTV